MKKLFILSLLFFTTDSYSSGIASNSASAPCDNNTLETYSGNSNLSADWQPNTINLRWYNDNEKLTVQQSAQSCTYDGTLNIPSTPPTRTGYTFAGWEVKYAIPAEYTELQYIESTGTQWINTDFIPDSNTRIKTKLKFNSDTNGRGSCFGSSLGGNNSGMECFMWGNGTLFFCCYGTSCDNAVWANMNDIIEIDWNKNVLSYKVNNGNITNYTFPVQTFTTAYKMALFALSRGYELSATSLVTIYFFQIYDNGTLARQFIPVRRNSDNVVGMWDTVSQTFFTNAGTGSFTAGPVVQ